MRVIRGKEFTAGSPRGARVKPGLAGVAFALCVGTAAAGQFGDPKITDRPPKRIYHVEHYALALHFDQSAGEVFGNETLRLRPLAAGLRRLYLDSADLQIHSVSLGSAGAKHLRYQLAGSKLWITLDHDYAPADILTLRVSYHGFPRSGLYFVNPSREYPGWPREIWSQGEPESNHHWFPCWDFPNDMSTTELSATVPAGQSVVSNGRLVSVTRTGGRVTYHWFESVPHSTYLTSIAVGPWRKVSDHFGRTPVDYYVPNTVDEATARRSFHLTPDMLDFFSEFTGVRWPYEKYSQVTVKNFIFGGMENVSATTLSDATLHDAKADADYPSTLLVDHELGQNWFGDYVQGGDWADIWLNEGFATYLDALYAQHLGGFDAYRDAMLEDQQEAQEEDRDGYRRPIVDHHYTDPLQMLDVTTHEKGAAVLDMLRDVVDGPDALSRPASQREPLFAALHQYLVTFHAQSVTTRQLIGVIEHSTHRHLGWFFHEWVYMAGQPDYRVSADYDAGARVEKLEVAQTQKLDAVTPIFRMPIEVAFHGAHGKTRRVRIWDERATQEFTIPLAFRPLWVSFDPDGVIDKTLQFHEAVPALVAQAERDGSMRSRLWAVEQLGTLRGAEADGVVPALDHVLQTDGFYRVRAAAATSLGTIGGVATARALQNALGQPDDQVRTAVVTALSKVKRDTSVFVIETRLLRTDPSYAVQAAAATAIGASGNPGAFEVLSAHIDPAWDRHLVDAILEAITATHDPRAAGLLFTWSRPGIPERERDAALTALAQTHFCLNEDQKLQLALIVRAARHDPVEITRAAGAKVAKTYAIVTTETNSAKDEDEDRSEVPTGQFVTPLAAPGAEFTELNPHLKDFPRYRVGQAISEALSPDGRTLLILTSGFNVLYGAAGKQSAANSNEYVFVYDISTSRAREEQVLEIPDTFAGITFAPDGMQFYVSGGGDDDVHAYALRGGSWIEAYPPIKLRHEAANGIGVAAAVAGIAVTADGKELIAANYYDDSISLIDLASRTVRADLDLRPGKSGGPHGVAGGENPFWVAVKGSSTAYIGSQRDREVDVVDISSAISPRLIERIKLAGNPVKMLLDQRQEHLYVACDNSDVVAVIDTRSNKVVDEIHSIAPPGLVARQREYRGVAPNGLALSPDGSHLYVTNGGMNAVAVVDLDRRNPVVTGLIPTGWYPQAVVAGRLQRRLYVVNSRSNPGPNPGNPNHRGHPVESFAHDEYVLQLEKAGFLTFALPARGQLETLTQQVLANDHFNAPPRPRDTQVMAALRRKIRHVIYIIKENRTYDQVLGDLGEGNGDPAIAEFGAKITPNFHALARGFADLDNFYVSGEVSSDGWPWSTAARESDQGVKTVPPAYALRGIVADTTGLNRGINVAYATLAERRKANPGTPDDPDLLPGSNDVAGVDGPGGLVQQGYIWSAALRAGLAVRNYGMEGDTTRYDPHDPHNIPLDLDPHADQRRVMYPAFPDLLRISDPYYRSFDPAYPDFFREKEWQREFLSHIRHGDLPQLSLLWLPGDHMGDFARALDGVNTPELQQADNDYAVGLLVQAVADSPYRSDTLIFIVEDDAQDGPDHVDAHRSTAYVIGPYVRQHAVVSDYFTTVSLLRTMEDILGIDHLSIFDAHDRPMTDIFDLKQKDWTFRAEPSCFLAGTRLPIGAARGTCLARLQPTHDAAYWAAQTRDMDFSSEDKIDPVRFNRIVWRGLLDTPYPTARSGADMRH